MMFADEQGSAPRRRGGRAGNLTGVIGFIGGTDVDLIWRFHAGYAAGARALDPDIKVRASYLTRPPDFSGFQPHARARCSRGPLFGRS